MQLSEKNTSETTTTPHRHAFRTLVLWLVILIIILLAFLMFMGNFPGWSERGGDPAARFLQENTRATITEDDISAAGTFLQETTVEIPLEESQTIDNFFQIPDEETSQ